MNADRAWFRRSVWLVVLVTLARAVYVLWLCPYALAADEAHYWEWSRRLDWSYYSKGPGIAWLIRIFTEIFGDSEGGIRLAAVVMGAITAFAGAGLTRTLYKDQPFADRAAFFAACLILLTPAYQIASLLSTIDGPYFACWILTAWMLALALVRGKQWAWIAAAGVFGIGFLFKYTILLLLPGLVGFLLTSRGERSTINRRTLAGASMLALVLASPVVVWNARHDWVTVRHLLGHLGVAGGDVHHAPTEHWAYDPMWTLELIGTQLGAAGLLITLGLLGLIHARREKSRSWPGERLMLWLALPVLGFYLAISFITDVEANWPVAGYLTLVPLAARVVVERPARFGGHTRRLWIATITIGLITGVGMLRVDLLAKAANALGLNISVQRIFSSRGMAREIGVMLDGLEAETGRQSFVIANHYGRASLFAYYLRNRPVEVVCSSSRWGGRKNQYDFWPDTDLDDLEHFGGRPAVMIGQGPPDSDGTYPERWPKVFDRVVEMPRLVNEHKSGVRRVFLGYGYTGFKKEQTR